MGLDLERIRKTLESHMSAEQAERVLKKMEEAYNKGERGEKLKDVYTTASADEGILTTTANETLMLNTAGEEI